MKDPRIVLLERDDLAREVYTEYLVAAGFRVRAEALFDDALAAIRKGNVPVVVVGVGPGGAAVADVTGRIRNAVPGTAVVAILGRDAAESPLRAVRDGALEALTRPISAAALVLAVRRCLETTALLADRPALRRHVEAYLAARRVQRSGGEESTAERLLDGALAIARAEAGLVLRPETGTPALLQVRGVEEALCREVVAAWEGERPGPAPPISRHRAGAGPLGRLRARIARLWPDYLVARVGPPPGRLVALLLGVAPERADDPTVREDLELLVGQAAFALEARAGDADDGEVSIDPLTDLYDARFLERTVEHEIVRARHRGGELALLAVDLEGFRHLNDTHGHVAGGRVLVEASRLLVRAVRDVDVVARIGADEFGVLLAARDEAGADRVARRIRDAFARHRFLSREGLDVRLSAGVGIAVFPRAGDTARALLDIAGAQARAQKPVA